MWRGRVEKQRVTSLERVEDATVVVGEDATQHIDELAANMLERGENVCVSFERHQGWFDGHHFTERVPEYLVLVAATGAAPLHI